MASKKITLQRTIKLIEKWEHTEIRKIQKMGELKETLERELHKEG